MIDKINDLKDSTVEVLRSRLGDPIIGSYFLSFSIIHWQIFIYLFSSLEAGQKVTKIKEIITPQLPLITENKTEFIFSIISHPIVIPIYVAFFYLFLFPLITKKALKIILMNKVELENDRFEAELKLSPIQLQISQLEERLTREVDRVNNLNNLKSSHEETIRLLKEENEKLKDEMINNAHGSAVLTESRIAANLRDKKISIHFKNLSDAITTSYVRVGREIAEGFKNEIPIFVSYNLIERQMKGTSEAWVLTDLGKSVRAQL